MKRAQYNYVKPAARVLAVLALILAANTASAQRITYPAKPDPLLDGGDTNPCMAGADLAAGVDATGQPVIPADVGAPPIPVPDEIMVPLGSGPAQPSYRGRRQPNPATGPVPGTGGGAYAGFDGRRMAPLLNPRPCR
jgi:hypothetical protein